jgi:hypothetical protein
MRAGLIISGVLLLIIGYFLTLTIIGAIIGIPIGFIGFIMIIVGLVTSGTKVVFVQGSPRHQPVGKPIPNPSYKVSDSKPDNYCANCGTRLPESASFCPSCGHKQ